MNVNDYNYNYLTFSYSEPRLTYNTKIDKDGILNYYHSYSLTSPLKLSGWYSVDSDISALEIAQNAILITIPIIEGQIQQIEAENILFLSTDYLPFKTATTESIALLNAGLNLRSLRAGREWVVLLIHKEQNI